MSRPIPWRAAGQVPAIVASLLIIVRPVASEVPGYQATGYKCGNGDIITYGSGGCNGWGSVTADQCAQYCASNTIAANCANFQTSSCSHFKLSTNTGWCHLYKACTNSGEVSGNDLFYVLNPDPPAVPPAPAASPPTSPGATSGISGDPHIKGAHGDEADFKGEHRGVYNVLSARNFSLSLRIEHDTFTTPFSRLNVHGSWVRAAFHTVRTIRTGRLLRILFLAAEPHRAVITEGCAPPDWHDRLCNSSRAHIYAQLTDGGPPFALENVKVSLRRKVLTVANGQWRTSCASTVGAPHVGKLRMNAEIKPTYAEEYDSVSAHGLVGQTYDRDHLEVNGRKDDYSHLDNGRLTASRMGVGGDVTTRAKAEGAIEGTLEDYRVAANFATAFRYSRFDATSAPVRNVSALTGQVGRRHTHVHPARETG